MATELREALRKSAREHWDTLGVTMRSSLASQAYSTGFAKCIEDLMAKGTAGTASYKKCAKDKGLKRAYKGAWGKPVA